jgi:hypothetical protein
MGTGLAAPIDVTFRATGVEAVRSGIRSVRSEVGGAEAAAEGLSHSAVIGFGELSRGLGRIAETGQASAFAMRELSGGIMRLGSALGPVGGLIGIFAILGGVIVETFMKARKEIEDTRKKYEEEIAKMANSGKSSELQQQLRNLESGQPYDDKNKLTPISRFASGAFTGSIRDLQGQRAMLESELQNSNKFQTDMVKRQLDDLDARLKPLLAKRDELTAAIMNVASQPATMNGLLPTRITANSDKRDAKDGQKAIDFLMESIMKQRPGVGIGVSGNALDDAVDEQKKLFELLKKYNPAVDQSAVRKALEQSTAQLGSVRVKAAGLPNPSATVQQINGFMEQVQQPTERIIRDGFATTIGSAISDGVTQGFESHSIGGAFKAAGKAILAGLGGILEQMGQVWVSYGIAMTSLGQALWNPLTSGPAAIAIGALLIGLGATLGAVAHGGTGSGPGGGTTALPAIVNTAFLDPGNQSAATRGSAVTPQKSQTNQFFIIGPNDPQAGRQIQKLLDNNAARG